MAANDDIPLPTVSRIETFSDDKDNEIITEKEIKENMNMFDMAANDEIPPPKMAKIGSLSDDEDDENLTYEELREKRIKENMALFEIFGINHAAESLANSVSKKPQKKSTSSRSKIKPATPTRRSLRIANIPADEFLTDVNIVNEPSYKSSDGNNRFESNVIDNDSIAVPEEPEFFEKLSIYSDLVIKEAVYDFHKCNFVKFTQVVKSLDMIEESPTVSYKRIFSLAIYPSETSLIIAAGDQRGHIAFYSKNHLDMRDIRVHYDSVNCISFCSWDPHKLFSTSHDGSVICGDIVKQTFDIIYSSDLWTDNKTKYAQSTWHTEYERNLLIGNGAGRVDLIDTRTPNKVNNTAWCHQRSVRTVQCHPLEKHYFLTSSGRGEVSLWDTRHMSVKTINPVLQFEHSASVTSAFFSATGVKMVSTSNDDIIRVFNTSKLNIEATKPVVKIPHDNHTGQYLSVFKAKWNPGRDDTFFVGSLQEPKRIQIFNANGSILHNLKHENMTSYCPVIEVHPTQAIYVGGNASGRLHIFSSEELLL